MKATTNISKTSWRLSQTKYHRWKFLLSLQKSSKVSIKETITEVLLTLPLYLILFLIWWKFIHLIKIMADVENILNDDDFLGDSVDTLKEGIEQHRKRECLKSIISKGKAYLLGSKWTQEKVEKASDETINKRYTEYKQHELNENGKKTGRVLGKHVINLC